MNHVAGIIMLCTAFMVIYNVQGQALLEQLGGYALAIVFGAMGWLFWVGTERNYAVHGRKYDGSRAEMQRRVHAIVSEMNGRVLHEERTFVEYIIPGRRGWWSINVLLTITFGEGTLHYNMLAIRHEDRSMPDLSDFVLVPRTRKAFEQALDR